jgi:uncharacterized protein (TIGR02246 family)
MTGREINDEDAIRQLVSTWMTATDRGDVETILSLISDDAVFLITGQPVMTKAAFAAAATAQWGDAAAQIRGTSEIQEIKVLGDWAFMRAELTLVITPARGRKFTRAGHTLSILKKEQGKWLLVRDADMLSPVPNRDD